MANKIKPKRSYTASAVPTTSDLDTHELAINWADNKAYTKNAAGSIVSVSLGGGSAAADSRWDLFLPPAPTSVTASAGNAQATVGWTAPTVLSQTPITDYTVQYSSDSGSSWTTFSRSPASTATSATVTGLTNGTSYTFRVSATNAVGTGSYSTASSAVSPGITDPYFSSVSLLLHMDGTGGTFVDSSASSLSFTATGSATQSATQSKYGGKSLYLPGSGSYISAANTAAANFGSGNFTIEFWMRASAQGLTPIIHQTSQSGSQGWIVWNYDMVNPSNATRKLSFFLNGTNTVFATSSDAYADNEWTHIAVVRNGSTVTIYSNGTSVGSTTFSGSIASPSTQLMIGGILQGYSWDTTRYFTGYIDDVRITKGVARTITVPTAAFPDA
jgi:hypothetical protein